MVTRRTGVGLSKGHFGEFLQGYFEDIDEVVDGKVKPKQDRASITVPLKVNLGLTADPSDQASTEAVLPPAKTGSLAVFSPTPDSEVSVDPSDRTLAKKAVNRILRTLKQQHMGGTLKIITNGGLSRGLGTSTADIVASIRAVTDSLRESVDKEKIGEIAATTEGASDGIMYDEATLFVTTRGKVLERFIESCPRIEIVGFDLESGEGGIDTLDLSPRHYSESQREKLLELRKKARTAFFESDVDLLGDVATQSARINQRFLEKPILDEIVDLTEKFDGDGVVIAHSGTLMGILFQPANYPSSDQLKTLKSQLESLGLSNIKHYSTGA
jgi:uncharacterized protein involved in propanediol utilization